MEYTKHQKRCLDIDELLGRLEYQKKKIFTQDKYCLHNADYYLILLNRIIEILKKETLAKKDLGTLEKHKSLIHRSNELRNALEHGNDRNEKNKSLIPTGSHFEEMLERINKNGKPGSRIFMSGILFTMSSSKKAVSAQLVWRSHYWDFNKDHKIVCGLIDEIFPSSEREAVQRELKRSSKAFFSRR